jgi:hypothetical protein
VSTGEQLKLAGIEKAFKKHGPEMVRAQLVAEMLGMAGDLVTADDVRAEFQKHYQRPLKVGNALGRLFLNRKWELMGFVRSKRAESHSRMIRTWRLKQHYQRKPEPFTVGVENGVRFCLKCSQETEKCTCPTATQ